MNIRRKVIISILFLSISLSNFNILNAKGTLGTNELNLKNNELPEYIKINPKDKLNDERLNKFLYEMYKKRMNGTYTYKGERQSDKVFDPSSTTGNASDYYEYKGNILLNPCDPPGVWDKLIDNRYVYLRFGPKCEYYKKTNDELFKLMMASDQMKSIISSPFTLRWNVFDATPLLGLEYWNNFLDKQPNYKLKLKATLGSDGRIIPSNTKNEIGSRAYYKYLVKTIYTKVSNNARTGGPVVNPDYVIMKSRAETSLTNVNSCAQKMNSFGFKAYNKTGCETAQEFKSVEEQVDAILKYFTCYSNNDTINKHCSGGNKKQLTTATKLYGDSVIGIENYYSGGGYKCGDEIKHPFNNVFNINKMMTKALKELNKYDEIVGKMDCKNKSDESTGKKVIRNGQVPTDK